MEFPRTSWHRYLILAWRSRLRGHLDSAVRPCVLRGHLDSAVRPCVLRGHLDSAVRPCVADSDRTEWLNCSELRLCSGWWQTPSAQLQTKVYHSTKRPGSQGGWDIQRLERPPLGSSTKHHVHYGTCSPKLLFSTRLPQTLPLWLWI